MAASIAETARLEAELAEAEAAEKSMELKMKIQAARDRTALLSAGPVTMPVPMPISTEPPLILSDLTWGGEKIECATYDEEERIITLTLAGGTTETGSVEVVSAKVAKEALAGRDLKGQQVSSCVDGGIASELKQFNQNQVGSLCGLGAKKGARIGEQRKLGRGSSPTTIKVVTVITAAFLLRLAGVTGNSPLYFATGVSLADLEAQGAIVLMDVVPGMPAKQRKPQHPVAYCDEWSQALKSTFKAVLESDDSHGKMTLTPGIVDDAIDLFWTLLQGNVRRKSASAIIYDKGKQSLVTSELKCVMENWLGQSRSVAAGLKATNAKKRKAELPAEGATGATAAQPLQTDEH